MTTKVALTVNDAAIPLDYFAQSLVDHVVRGILEALEGTGTPDTVDLSVAPAGVNLKVNGAAVPTNPFVSRVITNTLFGLASSLKGVSQINTLRVEIKK
ncbi:MAG: hypothetical protein C4555_06125 [Dehalococcoidia bacterium]|jgi:hypothetical protein|nr:MAG: hypothetical protein C4555_06125 [Dehalococcoidia bacterium]